MVPRLISVLFLFSILGLTQTTWANVSLPSFFSDHMVLQQNTELSIWGWAKPGENIVVSTTWNTQYNAIASNQGSWSVLIKTPTGSMTPYDISIKGYNEILLKNVLIGEVWLCSGQSNMEWSANSKINNAEEEIKQANFPAIRFFSVEHRTA
ncbi:MAG TPA: sialate O-acetylesterase, partial [Haliscomenobacter sp.]|nr:sialate O-acetylesterase [Haliscomenobacter sp.]